MCAFLFVRLISPFVCVCAQWLLNSSPGNPEKEKKKESEILPLYVLVTPLCPPYHELGDHNVAHSCSARKAPSCYILRLCLPSLVSVTGAVNQLKGLCIYADVSENVLLVRS